MSEKDIVSVEYLEDNEHYADLINTYYFQGEEIVKPSDITVRDTREALSRRKGRQKNPLSLQRDIVRGVNFEMRTAILAVDEQSEIHYAMPVRVMAMDALNYYKQWRKIQKAYMQEAKNQKENTKKDVVQDESLKKDFSQKKSSKFKKLSSAEFLSGFAKDDRLTLVDTLILYFGAEPWDGPTCLKDMLDLDGLPSRLVDLVADYPIHILDVRRFTDYELFKTDWKWLFGFLQRDTDKDALMNYIHDNKEAFENLSEDTYDMISQFSHAKVLVEDKEEFLNERGNVNVCKALDDLMKDSEIRGEARGIEIGEIRGKIGGILAMCKECGMSAEQALANLVKLCGLKEEDAKKYILQY